MTLFGRSPAVLGGRYELLGVIGEGGMGLVYEGRDLTLSRPVAIKRLREEFKRCERERRRFVAEARIVARLRHPNIVAVHEVIEERDELFLVFELIGGQTLHDKVSRRGTLAWPEPLSILSGMAAAVDFAHERGVVHRDLKPGNVLLCGDGTVKVTDFGVALLSAAGPDEVAGTPAYMAPEQAAGESRPESDLFSLGVCLYEMACGCRPFTGDEAEMLESKRRESYLRPSEAAPGVPPGLDAVVEKALRARPGERYATAGLLVEALAAALRSESLSPA